MSSKFALIIANTEYSDPGLAQLTAPGMDAREFGRVLDSPELGAFEDVIILFNENSSKVAEIIDFFFSAKKPNDLLLLYFSGHGVRDEYGSLYLAVKNTNRARLRSTAIKSDFIREAMDESRSKRQVLILDCCNSGAFAQGTKAEIGGSIGTAKAFEGTGYGRIVLTASDSTQFAWEGDKVIGQDTSNSLFTHFLVKGLEGEADRNSDGKITVDELYDYAYEQVVERTPKQTPGKWSYKQQGDIVLRENLKPSQVKPAPLPVDILDLLLHQNSSVRKMGLQDLISLLDGKHLGLARAAEEKLRDIVQNDDSFSLRKTAYDILLAHGFVVEEPAPPPIPQESKAIHEEQSNFEESTRGQHSQQVPLSDRGSRGRISSRSIAWIVGGLLIMGLLAWGGSRLLQNLPAATAEPTSTTQTDVQILAQVSPTATTQIEQTSTPSPTETLMPVTPTLGIGSTMTGIDEMTLLYVPAGDFLMGGGNASDEQPPHTVTLKAFWIDQTEVTNRMYILCVDAGECKEPKNKLSYKQTDYYGNVAYNNHPVIQVDWDMAKAYCEWAGRRLPTEAEWEKAARGGDGRIYPWGNELPNKDLLNYKGVTGDVIAVGTYQAGKSPYGAYDMAGNVWEWVADFYDANYYSNSPKDNPSGPTTGIAHVQRGGSWVIGDTEDWVRSSKRDKGDPGRAINNLGFRCAMDATP